jgi:hypothetical membrane protein
MNRYAVSTRWLATTALAGLVTFPVLVVALHLIQGRQYHPLTQAVSDLALGRQGWLLAIAFCAAGAGLICLAILLRRTVSRSVVAPVLLAIAALFVFVAAAFHADGDAPTTLHGQIHVTASLISFVLMIAAMFVCSRRFRLDPAWRRLALPTLVWAFSTVGAFFLIGALGDAYFGLGQRIFIATWLTWLITVAAYARQSVGRQGFEPNTNLQPEELTRA